MTSDFPRVWTPLEIAEMTKTRVEDVLAEIEAGRLRAFRIGSEQRVTDSALKALIMGDATAFDFPERALDPVITKTSQVTRATWEPADKFQYTWPAGSTEAYESAFKTDVVLASGSHRFLVGYTERTAVGMKNRQRVIVFLGDARWLVPIVEFAGANNFEQTRHVASVVKDSTNRHVRTQAQLPVEYQGISTAIYSDVVVGPYAAHSVAVVADYDDRDLMLRHAIIRAKYKGLIEI